MLVLIAVLILLIVIAILAILSRPSETEWDAGYKNGKNAPTDEKQGENGWYFMYSSQKGAKGDVDVSKLKNSKWGTKGSCWFYYGVDGMWLPAEYAADSYDPDKNGCWWLQDTEGHMNVSSKTAYTGAVAWEAPYNGTYTFNVKYEAGSNSYEWEGKTYYLTKADGGDGLYLSLNTDKKVLARKFCGLVTKSKPDLTKGTIKKTIELKKGDRVYLCEDPGKSANGDSLTYKMKITLDKSGFNFKINSAVEILLVIVAALLIGFIFSTINKRQE